jgi:tight adherence protein B
LSQPVLIAIAVAGAFSMALCIYAVLAPGSPKEIGEQLLTERLSPFGETAKTATPVNKTVLVRANPVEALRMELTNAWGKRVARSDRGQEIARSLALASLKLRPIEWILINIGVTVAVGGLFWLRFGAPVMFLVGAVVGYFGCGFFLRFRANRRSKAFDSQLSPTMLSISNGLKAGYTFAQAIDLVSKSADQPMAEELARVVRETQLGRPLIEAMGKMVERNNSEEMRLLLAAIQIQVQTGANLAKIIDKIENTVRERIRIKGEIKTLTGQARASGWILIILPFALAGILSAIAPTYFTPMFSHLVGQILLGVGGFMLLCGYALIRKIVNVKV